MAWWGGGGGGGRSVGDGGGTGGYGGGSGEGVGDRGVGRLRRRRGWREAEGGLRGQAQSTGFKVRFAAVASRGVVLFGHVRSRAWAGHTRHAYSRQGVRLGEYEHWREHVHTSIMLVLFC